MRIVGNKMEFPLRDFKGSKYRCLLLTNWPRKQIARCLTELVQPYGVVNSEKDRWMPQGILRPEEARLSQTERFLKSQDRKILTNW